MVDFIRGTGDGLSIDGFTGRCSLFGSYFCGCGY